MNFRMYNVFLENIWGALNLNTADIRVALLSDPANSGGTDISTEEDVNSLSDFDGGSGMMGVEFDDGAYARVALAGIAVVRDDAGDAIRLTATNTTFPSLSNTGSGYGVGGVLVYVHVDGTEANDYPIALLPYEKTPNGTDFIVKWPSTGIVYNQQAAA